MSEWTRMTWLEVRRAASEANSVVVVPFGCVETQGPYTPTGMEFLMSEQLAKDVAERESCIALPSIPYGNSNLFQAMPGTIYVRPEVLTQLYTDILFSIARSGFKRILALVYHIPNELLFDQAARALRDKTGISAVWINPGVLAAGYLREVLPDPRARGHGAEPGLSLMRYLTGTELPAARPTEAQPASQYGGFPVKGPGLDFEGFNVGMPYNWDELYPDTSGYGDITLGSRDVGEAIYERMLGFICRVARVVKVTDLLNPRGTVSDAVGGERLRVPSESGEGQR